jgi:hypothetical protein
MGRLAAAHGLAADQCEIVVIKTTGDKITDRPLIEAGGKGLFTKELEEALFAGDIDLAVHSMKDMPAQLPAGLSIAAVLPREDARDAFVSVKYSSLDALPAGAVIGTSSPRRQAQALRLRPDLRIVPLRGNVAGCGMDAAAAHVSRWPGSRLTGTVARMDIETCTLRQGDSHRDLADDANTPYSRFSERLAIRMRR